MAHDHEHHYCKTLDIIPGTDTLSARGYTARAALLKEAYWQSGAALTVSFIEESTDLHRRVADIAKAWMTETNANIDFEFWIGDGSDPARANIRIGFDRADGSWSYLGRQAQNVRPPARTMNLGWMTMDLAEDKARAVVLHEFGHALGLIHEHMNPVGEIKWNKPRVIADLRSSQGWDDATIEANMFKKYKATDVLATDVDPASIMMYPIPPGWTTDGFTAGFNSSLTDKDRALIVKTYGVKPSRSISGGRE